jgi:hypothetical protein
MTAPEPPPGDDPPGGARAGWPRPRLKILAAAGVAVLLAAGALTVYLAAGRYNQGRFTAEPSACGALAPSVPLLGVEYTLRRNELNNCELTLPRDHPDYVAAPKILVSFLVADADGEGAPQVASRVIQQLGEGSPVLSGVGDEAYQRSGDVYLRVSNLVVAVVVYPVAASMPEQVRAFAADLANRLDTSA